MRKIITVIFGCLWASMAGAQSLPEPLSPFVNDFANIIPADSETLLAEDLQKLRADHGVEMTVVTVDYSSDYGDYTRVEPFATDLFNAWGVGNAQKNDGIVVLVAWRERAMRIELGAGYPPVYDDIAKTVIDDYFLRYFREDRYPEGITAGSLETIKRIAVPFATGAEVTAPAKGEGGSKFILWIVVALMSIPIFFRIFRDKIAGLRKCPSCGARHLDIERLTRVPATKERTGEQEITTTCRSCGYHHTRIRTLSKISSSGSSGFSGGSSSGGGASGRW